MDLTIPRQSPSACATLGMTMKTLKATHYTLLGIETPSLQGWTRHTSPTAVKVADWLEKDRPDRQGDLRPGCPPRPYYVKGGEEVCPKGAGSLFTYEVKAATRPAKKLIEQCRAFQPRWPTPAMPAAHHNTRPSDDPSRLSSPREPAARGGCDPERVRVSIGHRGWRRHNRRSRSGAGEGGGLNRRGSSPRRRPYSPGSP